eukprot:TRINITY_DN31584_c0_g1_i1.p1 TRINITY_DN31584_c0_g1~~TRINITY_DN31584_c0_g1_i1.p1  ORF type:complete len:678 (-),score=251.87 TRINITY_DN31584_c0_g1_i1:221-2254(-)
MLSNEPLSPNGETRPQTPGWNTFQVPNVAALERQHQLQAEQTSLFLNQFSAYGAALERLHSLSAGLRNQLQDETSLREEQGRQHLQSLAGLRQELLAEQGVRQLLGDELAGRVDVLRGDFEVAVADVARKCAEGLASNASCLQSEASARQLNDEQLESLLRLELQGAEERAQSSLLAAEQRLSAEAREAVAALRQEAIGGITLETALREEAVSAARVEASQALRLASEQEAAARQSGLSDLTVALEKGLQSLRDELWQQAHEAQAQLEELQQELRESLPRGLRDLEDRLTLRMQSTQAALKEEVTKSSSEQLGNERSIRDFQVKAVEDSLKAGLQDFEAKLKASEEQLRRECEGLRAELPPLRGLMAQEVEKVQGALDERQAAQKKDAQRLQDEIGRCAKDWQTNLQQEVAVRHAHQEASACQLATLEAAIGTASAHVRSFEANTMAESRQRADELWQFVSVLEERIVASEERLEEQRRRSDGFEQTSLKDVSSRIEEVVTVQESVWSKVESLERRELPKQQEALQQTREKLLEQEMRLGDRVAVLDRKVAALPPRIDILEGGSASRSELEHLRSQVMELSLQAPAHLESRCGEFRCSFTPKGDLAVYHRQQRREGGTSAARSRSSDFPAVPIWHAGIDSGCKPICSVNREITARQAERFMAESAAQKHALEAALAG